MKPCAIWIDHSYLDGGAWMTPENYVCHRSDTGVPPAKRTNTVTRSIMTCYAHRTPNALAIFSFVYGRGSAGHRESAPGKFRCYQFPPSGRQEGHYENVPPWHDEADRRRLLLRTEWGVVHHSTACATRVVGERQYQRRRWQARILRRYSRHRAGGEAGGVNSLNRIDDLLRPPSGGQCSWHRCPQHGDTHPEACVVYVG